MHSFPFWKNYTSRVSEDAHASAWALFANLKYKGSLEPRKNGLAKFSPRFYMKKHSDIQNLIERADRLIRLKATGTAVEFAVQLGISRATVVRLLKYLREKGASIKYCKHRRAYCYE